MFTSIWRHLFQTSSVTRRSKRKARGPAKIRGRSLHIEALESRKLLSATIATDHLDYSPGQTAIITGSGFSPGETVDLSVLNLSTNPVSPAGDPPNWTMVADADGSLQTSWNCTSDLAGCNLELDAKGETSGLSASELFTDAP